ncbi:major facilitator superfamily domain-containing protein [Lipomyces tetrasporus]|uniref:Major facilitator superfamily domain-containing protein n=1 Tax=Lipomyces tetrasporus TaxID=54092 RepID=A0AAD7VWE4_9ASCO|nr:major facilitator superfamily domain-containing protein [Lipomyces tetrasporus]KAJ8103390.1 major facilitator superfamily domain-containing protein [Lipomyces tetrasporus]
MASQQVAVANEPLTLYEKKRDVEGVDPDMTELASLKSPTVIDVLPGTCGEGQTVDTVEHIQTWNNPPIESHYRVTYTVISLCLLARAAGYMISSLLDSELHVRLGRWATIVAGLLLMCVAYSLICWAPPLPVLVISYGLNGINIGTLDAAWNAFVADFQNVNEIMGLMQGMYGVGATISPLISTAMATSGLLWSYYYFILLGLGICITCLNAYSFWGETAAKYLNDHSPGVNEDGESQGRLSEALKNRYTILLALTLFFYMGAEAGIGGWIVTFMVTKRQGDPAKMGAVASGFWVGLTAGRMALGFVTGRIGENTMTTVYLILSIVFELVVWLVPSIVASAVGVAFVGLFFGPVFPTVMIALTRLLPKRLHVAGIGFAAAFGGGGSAVFPIITGAMAESKGVWVLQPLIVALMCTMVAIWVTVPTFEETGLRDRMLGALTGRKRHESEGGRS